MSFSSSFKTREYDYLPTWLRGVLGMNLKFSRSLKSAVLGEILFSQVWKAFKLVAGRYIPLIKAQLENMFPSGEYFRANITVE
jgi:hypothetical protein